MAWQGRTGIVSVFKLSECVKKIKECERSIANEVYKFNDHACHTMLCVYPPNLTTINLCSCHSGNYYYFRLNLIGIEVDAIL